MQSSYHYFESTRQRDGIGKLAAETAARLGEPTPVVMPQAAGAPLRRKEC
jgi:hypothetical protein